MNSLKKGEGVPLLNFEGSPGVLLLNFEGGPWVPLLNFKKGGEGSRVLLLNFEGGLGFRVPGCRGPGSWDPVPPLDHAMAIFVNGFSVHLYRL